METLPFNACDYRCERCIDTDRCAVFGMSLERSERNSALGRDSDGLDSALHDVGAIFNEVKESLLESEEGADVNLDELASAGPDDSSEKARQEPLYRSAFDLMTRARDFLERAESVVVQEGGDLLEDVRWHHTIVPVKTFRAIRSADKPEMRFDAVNSAAVAIKSLTICIIAFDGLARQYLPLADDCKRLSLQALDLKRRLKGKFLSLSSS